MKTIEALDSSLIQPWLVPYVSKLIRLEVFQEIDSTNAYLLRQINEQSQSGQVCLAECQTSGYGRFKRPWSSIANGNIYLSLLWRFSVAIEQLSALSLVIAVALRRALVHYGVPSDSLTFKWPNDLLASKGKIGGILLETKQAQAGLCDAVIGVGLNVTRPKQVEADYNLASLTELLNVPIQRNKLVALILNELVISLQQFTQQGIDEFLSQWRQYDELKDKKVRLSLPVGACYGVAQGVDDKGRLLVCDEQGKQQVFNSGEVSLRRGLM